MTPLGMIGEWKKGCSCCIDEQGDLNLERPELCQVCTRKLIDALENSLSSDRVMGAAPTHVCRKCYALWRVILPDYPSERNFWTLVSDSCEPCCDTAEMGEQLRPITVAEVLNWATSEEAE